MKAFKDTKGRTWMLTVNLLTLKRVHDATGVDLTRFFFSDEGKRVTNYAVLFDVLCAVLKPQFDEARITWEEFGEAMDDESVAEEAVTALAEAVIDFFPEPKRSRVRTSFQRALSAGRRVQGRLVEKLPEATEEAVRTIETWMSSGSASSSEGGSDSTPAPSPSVS